MGRIAPNHRLPLHCMIRNPMDAIMHSAISHTHGCDLLTYRCLLFSISLSSLSLLKIPIPIHKAFRDQADRNGCEKVHGRMLLDEHSGQADHNDCKHNECFPRRMCALLFRPYRGNAQWVCHMERRTHAGVGVYRIYESNTLCQEIIICKLCRTQILPCRRAIHFTVIADNNHRFIR